MRRERRSDVPCITIELATFVDSKNEKDVLARPESLVQYTFVVALCGPKPSLNAKVKVEL